jgi:CBS domain-containing protein
VYWLGPGPLFATNAGSAGQNGYTALIAAGLGVLVGLASAVLSRTMYGFEDLFGHLPVHWMWWPAIGGVGIGVGGIFFPRGLGVGYDNIAELLRGNAPMTLLLGLIIAKSLMWAFSLGSGTSGGVLAPLLMIGGAMGELFAVFAHASLSAQSLWALVGMGAMLSGSLGVPLTAIVFSLELTHCLPALLPLMLACIAAHAVTSLIMPRSILTEKLSRRGYHLTREYGVDPLEMVSVMEVMSELPAGSVIGTGTESESQLLETNLPDIYAFADETCRGVAETMATSGVSAMPVVDRSTKAICGHVTVQDLLTGRRRSVQREQDRVRIFGTSR